MNHGFDVDIFLDAVRASPMLWNISHHDYHDKVKKRNAWMEVCSKVFDGFEGKSEKEKRELGTRLMKKWKNIRDCFFKTIKKKNGRASNSRPYMYSKQLEFLLEPDTCALTAISIDEENETEIDAGNLEELEEANTAEPVRHLGNRLKPASYSSLRANATKRTYRTSKFGRNLAAKRRRLTETNLMDFLSTPPVLPTTSAAVPPTTSTEVQAGLPQQDDDKSFFDSLLPAVKTLPLDAKLEFRCQVMDLLREMRYSVINSSAQHPPQQKTPSGRHSHLPHTSQLTIDTKYEVPSPASQHGGHQLGQPSPSSSTNSHLS